MVHAASTISLQKHDGCVQVEQSDDHFTWIYVDYDEKSDGMRLGWSSKNRHDDCHLSEWQPFWDQVLIPFHWPMTVSPQTKHVISEEQNRK
jgi:hypothetical protein